MTEKEIIRAVIERQLSAHDKVDHLESFEVGRAWNRGHRRALESIRDLIDSLPEEPSCPNESDLEVHWLPNKIRWRKIKKGERLPCPAYLWSVAFEKHHDYFEGYLMPNIAGCTVGADTWYLPVEDLVTLFKE